MLNRPTCEKEPSFNHGEFMRHENRLSMYLKEEERKHGGVSQLVNLLLSNFLQNNPLWRVCKNGASDESCVAGDGKLEREHEEGDVELDLPGPLRRHVLHPRGQH